MPTGEKQSDSRAGGDKAVGQPPGLLFFLANVPATKAELGPWVPRGPLESPQTA